MARCYGYSYIRRSLARGDRQAGREHLLFAGAVVRRECLIARPSLACAPTVCFARQRRGKAGGRRSLGWRSVGESVRMVEELAAAPAPIGIAL